VPIAVFLLSCGLGKSEISSILARKGAVDRPLIRRKKIEVQMPAVIFGGDVTRVLGTKPIAGAKSNDRNPTNRGWHDLSHPSFMRRG
jgi:hypothetical protein